MTLTGKALKDFEIWLRETHYKYYLSAYGFNPDTCNHALIIEWFDSVGVYISALPYNNNGTFFSKVMITKSGLPKEYFDMDEFNTPIEYPNRQEATHQAIIKANEIYNSLT